eukprot:gene20609-biopygen23576
MLDRCGKRCYPSARFGRPTLQTELQEASVDQSIISLIVGLVSCTSQSMARQLGKRDWMLGAGSSAAWDVILKNYTDRKKQKKVQRLITVVLMRRAAAFALEFVIKSQELGVPMLLYQP